MKKVDELLTLIILLIAGGCTSPLIEVNRTGSALPDINVLNSSLNGNSADGNTVPVSAVP
jgi:hypothetical protein